MKQTDRPGNDQKCAREQCGHAFGVHFIAHDGKTRGCAYTLDDQREGYVSCHCHAFLIAYEYPAPREIDAESVGPWPSR